MYPVFYYLIAVGLLVVLIRQCRPGSISRRAADPSRSDALFLGLALTLLVFMRVPSVFYNRELNPDESQLLTQAITLKQDPVYGRSVDGTSIGPINTYLLLIPSAFGRPLDYTAARLTGLLLIALSLLLFYRSLLRLTTPAVSRLSFLPLLLFFSWATDTDFLHYSSELSSLLILTACFYQTVRLLQSTRPGWTALAGLGIVAGLTPYAKLQTLPVVGMMLITLALYGFGRQRLKAIRPLVVLSAGFLLPTVVVFGLAYGFGVERYFIDYYFIGNLTTYSQIYANVPLVSQGFLPKLFRFPAFLARYADFLVFVVFNCLAVSTVALIVSRRQRRPLKAVSWTTVLIVLTALGALWAVVTPGTEFGHHLLLLAFPLGWLSALALQQIVGTTANRHLWPRLVTFAAVVFVLDIALTDNLLLPYGKRLAGEFRTKEVVSTKPQLKEPIDEWRLVRNPYLFSFPDKMTLPLSPASRVIRQYTTPSDKIAVWGWNCQYYVETGLAQGVSENHTQRSIIPNKLRDRYLSRYARELRENRPALFVDAVGNKSWMLIQPQHRHEQFAGIDRVVRQQYDFVTQLDDVRIYVRRDRLSSQHRTQNPKPTRL